MAAIIQSQTKPKWPPGHKYGGPCKCKCKLRYIQPDRPASFKPLATFRKPDCKVADGTTYKMSYYGFDPNLMRHCRGQPIVSKVNLTSAGDFSSDTTHKMSYGAWPGYKPIEKIVPPDHKLLGDGPLSQLTTHKHDYTPKPIMEVNKIVQPGNLGFSGEPMEDKTTQNMSYQFPDMNRFEPAHSFKPQQSFNPPRTKMEDKTTQKLSYQPFCPPEKEEFPWAQKDKYRPPVVPFEGSTIYNGSYFAPGQFVEDCVGPDGCYCMYPGECFDAAGEPPKAHEFDRCPVGYDPRRDAPRPPPITEEVRVRPEPGQRDLNKEC
uniref:Protein FAM154B n=1 Tax=Cuerna arida TaxID=1464854 RepID=A0A1B6FNK7_9HEMI